MPKIKKAPQSMRVQKKRIVFRSEKIVCLHLAKCTTESLLNVINYLAMSRRRFKHKRIKKETKNRKETSDLCSQSGMKDNHPTEPSTSSAIKTVTREEISKKEMKKFRSLGRIFISQFRYFARVGEDNNEKNTLSYHKTLRWLKKSEILDNHRVTIRDVEVHFIDSLRDGYELKILHFIHFLKSLCEDRGLKMSYVLGKLLTCRKKKSVVKALAAAERNSTKKNKPKYKSKKNYYHKDKVDGIKAPVTGTTEQNPRADYNETTVFPIIQTTARSLTELSNRSKKGKMKTKQIRTSNNINSSVIRSVTNNSISKVEGSNPSLTFFSNRSKKDLSKNAKQAAGMLLKEKNKNSRSKKKYPKKQNIDKLDKGVHANPSNVGRTKFKVQETKIIGLKVSGRICKDPYEQEKYEFDESDEISEKKNQDLKFQNFLGSTYYEIGAVINKNKADEKEQFNLNEKEYVTCKREKSKVKQIKPIKNSKTIKNNDVQSNSYLPLKNEKIKRKDISVSNDTKEEKSKKIHTKYKDAKSVSHMVDENNISLNNINASKSNKIRSKYKDSKNLSRMVDENNISLTDINASKSKKIHTKYKDSKSLSHMVDDKNISNADFNASKYPDRSKTAQNIKEKFTQTKNVRTTYKITSPQQEKLGNSVLSNCKKGSATILNLTKTKPERNIQQKCSSPDKKLREQSTSRNKIKTALSSVEQQANVLKHNPVSKPDRSMNVKSLEEMSVLKEFKKKKKRTFTNLTLRQVQKAHLKARKQKLLQKNSEAESKSETNTHKLHAEFGAENMVEKKKACVLNKNTVNANDDSSSGNLAESSENSLENAKENEKQKSQTLKRAKIKKKYLKDPETEIQRQNI